MGGLYSKVSQKFIHSFGVPTSFDGNRRKKARKRLDTFTDIETKNAIIYSLAKYAEPGKAPEEPSSQPNVDPKEQRTYFQYRIEELESRIQLIEYTIQEGRLDPDQAETAYQDLGDWKKELLELKQVQNQIPDL